MKEIYNDGTLDLTNLKRTPEKEAEYQDLLIIINRANSTPEQAVLDSLNGEKLVKVINPFRYELDDTMEHYLIWSTEPDNTYVFETPALFRFRISKQIKNKLTGKFELKQIGEEIIISKHNLVAMFINSPEKKSVNLQHWHVIIKK